MTSPPIHPPSPFRPAPSQPAAVTAPAPEPGDGIDPGARVLAIDPALRNCGWAMLERGRGTEIRSLGYGVIRNPADRPVPECLAEIAGRIEELIRQHAPGACAIESVIYVQSVRTALALGAARGVVLAAAARAGLSVCEYAPRMVKRAVVGRGGAVKSQVGFMVRALLGLTETPAGDAADALAVGITHLQARGGGAGAGFRR